MTKISFLDFWHNFDVNNNFFVHMMSKIKDNVVVTSPNDCDILFFSCYGDSNNLPQFRDKYRIFYTGENLRPVFDNNAIRNYNTFTGRCDLALSFDYEDYDGRNIRLPLWLLQIDWFEKVSFVNPKFMIPYNEIYDNRFSNKPKDKFCCMVFNSNSPHRYEILEELSKYKQVDCYGQPFGNWFDGEDMKLDVISNYKFNICFENSVTKGYYTEKPIHAKLAGCVPVYWSDKSLSLDMNYDAFINLSDFGGVRELADYIIDLDNNQQKYDDIKNQRIFDDNQDPKKLFDNIMSKMNEKISVL